MAPTQRLACNATPCWYAARYVSTLYVTYASISSSHSCVFLDHRIQGPHMHGRLVRGRPELMRLQLIDGSVVAFRAHLACNCNVRPSGRAALAGPDD